MLVCVCTYPVWSDIDVALLCVQTRFQRRANVTEGTLLFVVCVHVVSATPLDSRIYVTCRYVFVFCHVSKSMFFFCTILSVRPVPQRQESVNGLDVIQPHPPKPNPGLCLWCLDRWARLLSRWPEDLHAPFQEFSGRSGWWHLGCSCLFILFLAGELPDQCPV